MRDLSVVMEVVALLLPPIVLVVTTFVLVTAAATGARPFVAATASWSLFGAVAILGPWLPLDTGTPADGSAVTVAVANVLAENDDPQAVDDILAIDADVLVVPEVHAPLHARLRDAYEFARQYRTYTSFLGVYSRYPAQVLRHLPNTYDPQRYARVRIDGPTPFVLWGLHLPRPWFTPEDSHQMRPGGHARTVDAVLDAIADEDLPVVVAGDLNLTDRGRGYRRMTADLDDAMRGISGRRTSLKGWFRPLLLRIDHILVPPDWCADRAARFRISGSDHRGVTARIGPCASR